MITAGHAQELTNNVLNNRTLDQVRLIECAIDSAIADGKFTARVNFKLLPSTKEYIDIFGYKISSVDYGDAHFVYFEW